MSVEITEDNSTKIKELVRSALEAAKKDAAEDGKTTAVALCPVGPGKSGTHLKETIEVEGGGVGSVTLSAGAPSKGVDYTGFVEFGTYKDEAQPFMGPAIPVIEKSLAGHAKEEVGSKLG